MLLKSYSEEEHVNVGAGEDLTILELAELVARVVGFSGRIVTDPGKPDGAPRKLMSDARLRAKGWRPAISLTGGVALTYAWFLEHAAKR